jgi:kinesin family protein C2/C3
MVFLENVTVKKAKSLDELDRMIKLGTKKRATAATNMNEHSSRSHLIISLLIKTRNLQTDTKTIGKVCRDTL